MNLNEHITLWNHASFKMMDVRYKLLEQGEVLREYYLPASTFLCAVRGRAEIWLDEAKHTVNGVQVLHGGKGARLDISVEERFEYYLIIYKAELSLPAPQEWVRFIAANRPFQIQYGFIPLYSLSLLDKVERMFEMWMKSEPLNKFQARTLFYQFVHELFWQMQRQGIQPVQPDLVSQVLRFMNERYMEPISLDRMADLLDCSTRYLTKLFKNEMNESPMRFLTQVRMGKAAQLLTDTEAQLQEIALLVGYPDAHTLSRSFKKYYGIPPALFRSKQRRSDSVLKLPRVRSRSAIVSRLPLRYSDNGYENRYHLIKKGDLRMYKERRPAAMAAVTLLFCMTLFLSACAGGTNTGNISAGTEGKAVSGQNSTKANSTQSSPTAATKNYTDSQGTVVIPANPQRIVDLTGSFTGNLLALGVKPVGVQVDLLKNPFLKGMMDGVETVGDSFAPEKVLSMQPDLIIVVAAPTMEQTYKELDKIAPVIRLEYGKYSYKEQMLEYGKLAGKEQEAANWLKEWDKKINEYKPQIVKVVGDRTVSILQPYAKGIYAFGDFYARGGEILYGEFGLKAPKIIKEKVLDKHEGYADLSLEQLPEFAGDYIFTSNWGWDNGDPNVVYGSNLWKGLPAVKENHIFHINAEGSYYNDAVSMDAHLAFIAKSFLGK
ncbi:AraC family transcriptional regulator [Paenibacillus sp. HWE-109]|uniref:AraC family transcriptional regulator n=1 Tax=Paenibacillus sp. HWE-109 TaxID=1306526 RepID=UPI001EDF2B4C|nr:AraC family transcriptional regulator [Paenibacillus sp. HWE-109]UKS25939.1 AraC family transcriptional regulator [Paenibacillus sp. HWE-109]